MSECGIIPEDERVELLDGLIVAMPPPSPPHDSAVQRVMYVLLRKLGLGVSLRVQSSFVAGDASVPQPDLALVPGGLDDYLDRHPSRAWLLVEVAHTSVSQDRLTKAGIYARAGIPCYWVVNLRDRCIEVFREPDRFAARYAQATRASGTEPLVIDAFPGVTFEARELLPPS
jgi:Uma2 family endonuclease